MYTLAPSNPDNTVSLYFDASRRSRILCKAGLVICWLAGFVDLGIAIWLMSVPAHDYLNLDKYAKEILPLGLNILVTMMNETLDYIHTNSLRWALQREGRLAFNSNLGLFTSAHTSKANAWYSNVVMFTCIVMSYASTSLIFIGDVEAGDPLKDTVQAVSYLPVDCTIFVCSYALFTLAIGILGQCIIATAALRSTVASPTWSPNPIDTAAACAVTGAVHGAPGRCLRSVRCDGELPNGPFIV